MSFRSKTNQFIDWFIPQTLLADREMRTRARMFLFSHLFGPFLGNVIPAYLFVIDPSSHGTLTVLAASITSFWLYPLALRWSGRYELLSYLSIQNLLFSILWGCYFYGGISSPFLPWLVTVPLLAFFYLGATPKSVATILSQVAANSLVFVIAYVQEGKETAQIPINDLQTIGIVSIISASVYVSMMAIFYARILDSQVELEAEATEHLATATELREAAAQAERAGAAKSEFLAKMSHELRTPLNAVIGYSQILLEDADTEEEAQVVADLDRIHSAGVHLLSIVNSILDLSKIEAGKMEVHNGPVAVAAMFDDLSTKHARAAQAAGNALSMTVDPAVGIIVSDGPKLSRIIDTLLTNAVGYTRNGIVTVTAKRIAAEGGSAIEIVVADTGPGIEPTLLPTLFADFTKRNDQSASRYAGAGLGLPLGHRLCGLLSSTLQIESTIGIGTRGIVRVPAAPPARKVAPPAAARPLSAAPALRAA